jgi:hypothetical protein
VGFQAAISGSLALMQWLKEQGCVFSASTMAGAAAKGHTAVCQFLYAAGNIYSTVNITAKVTALCVRIF